jgi:CD109 antigen
METNSLVGIDRALVRLYRSLGLRQYLNETFQTNSPLFNMTTDNITTAYQKLQLYCDYDGSYSFVSDKGTQHSSLYLTSLAFGAMISPMMPFHDNVTLNRTLNWILSHQQEDGSFDDNGPCFHYQFCSGKFRRESLTAIVLYSLTHDNASDWMPQFIHQQLYHGENCPIIRAQNYLESRVPHVKSNLLMITLFEMAFIQNRTLSPILREKIHQALLNRKLTVVPEDGSKYLKNLDGTMTFDDQLLVNALTISLYASFEDYKTTSDIARWVVDQIQTHPYYDTVLDAVFRTEAWLKVDCLFRKQFDIEKFSVTVDITADNGQKQQFKIDSKNMDLTQTCQFTLPVHQLTYSVHGSGLVSICILQKFAEQQQQKQQKLVPFELTQEFVPMSWFSEIKAKTCMTYTPTKEDQKLFPDNLNRTIVIEVQLPSGKKLIIFFF